MDNDALVSMDILIKYVLIKLINFDISENNSDPDFTLAYMKLDSDSTCLFV